MLRSLQFEKAVYFLKSLSHQGKRDASVKSGVSKSASLIEKAQRILSKSEESAL